MLSTSEGSMWDLGADPDTDDYFLPPHVPSTDAPVSRATAPPMDGPLSGLHSDDDNLMDWTHSAPSHATTITPGSPLKRKRLFLDHVLLPPLSALDIGQSHPISPECTSPRKKSRQTQLTTPRRNPPRNSGVQKKSKSRDSGTSPPPESPREPDTFTPDVESCLDSILNQLAEETQRREALQQVYASAFNVVAEDAGLSSSFPDENEPDLFPDSYEDVSDDELSQNLFDNPFLTLDLRDGSPTPDSELNTRLDEVSDMTFLDDPVAKDGPSPNLYSFSVQTASTQQEPVLAASSLAVSPHLLLRDGATSGSPPQDDLMPPPSLPIGNIISGPNKVNIDSGISSVNDESHAGEMSPGFEPHEPHSITAEPEDDNVELLANLQLSDSDSDGPSDSTSRVPRSHCPCNQCSPRPSTHPDYQPSRHSQQDIHRLFALSPFARHRPVPSS